MIKRSILISLFIIIVLCPMAAFGSEYKKENVRHMELINSSEKKYDHNAKTMYSENNVKAFVYNWFSGFDHQADVSVFKRHLNPEKIDMLFPGFPIKSMTDFERWYSNIIDDIQWNSHRISNLKVSGDEITGFFVSLDINWKAKTYKDETYDMNIHQEWIVKVDKTKNFVIEKHRALVIDKQ